MSAAADDLVGRGQALALIDRVLDAVAAGGPGFLAVVGEPGIGKTSVMERLSELATARDWLVLAGRAAEFERELPFGVLVDALDDYLATLDHRRLERAGGERMAELAAIFPSLDGPAMPDGALQTERYRAHRAVQELLDGLAVGKPLLLSLDDLHWADQASLEVVASLLRRPPDGPVLLACAFRPAPAPAFLDSALAAAEREGRAERIELGPLTPEAAAELLAGIAEPSVRDAVFRVSRREPVLPLAARAPGAPPAGPARRRAPGRHAHARRPAVGHVDARRGGALAAARLAPRARGGGRRGEPFEPDVAAEIGEVTDAEVSGALDDLLARDLVRTTDVPRQFRFRHPLVRRAVYAHAGGGWRLAAHGRAATALAARGASAGAQAHHVEHSARRGDEQAIALLSRAAATARAARSRDGRALAAGRRPARPGDRVAGGHRAARRAVVRARGGAARMRPARRLPDDAAAGARARAARRTPRSACGSSPRAPPSSTGSAATPRRARGSTPRSRTSAPSDRRAPSRCASSAPSSTCTRWTSRPRAPSPGRLTPSPRSWATRARSAATGAILTLTAVAGGDVAAARESVEQAAERLDGLRDAELADDLVGALVPRLGGDLPRALRGRAGAPAPRHRGLARHRTRRPDRADAARPGARPARARPHAGGRRRGRGGDRGRARLRQPAVPRLGALGARPGRAA